ncbi:MAG: hypothetical protein ACJA2M_000040 [Polaribacter sp.]|jgi:hypothetical protein
MKTFIKKTVLTGLTFILGIMSFVFFIHFIVKHKSDFTISKENDYIILGHSHPESAFNDELIGSFKNLSRSGESYFYTFQKVKEVVPNNTVKAIFIEYSNTLILKEMDDWIWGYEKMNAYFPWHSPSMDKDDILFLHDKNPQDFSKAISTSTRKNLTRILSLDFNIDFRYGGHNKLEVSNIEKLMKERKNDITQKTEDISIENLNYLEKIINYCKFNNVKVYLIRSPQHKYFSRKNEQTLLSLKKQKFENLEFLDFDKFPLEDNEFADFGHLNSNGAEIFSLWFNDLVENGLLSIDNKTAYINKEIEKVRTYESAIKN